MDAAHFLKCSALSRMRKSEHFLIYIIYIYLSIGGQNSERTFIPNSCLRDEERTETAEKIEGKASDSASGGWQQPVCREKAEKKKKLKVIVSPLADLHQEGSVSRREVGEKLKVHRGAQVVRVRDEHVLHALRQQLYQKEAIYIKI